MPNNQRAAAWFLNAAVISKFRDLARTKKFAIKNLNSNILRMNQASTSNILPSDPSNACQSCFLIFDGKSKPSRCSDCGKFFHKTKCHKEHSKNCRVSTSTNVSPPIITQAIGSAAAHNTTPVISSNQLAAPATTAAPATPSTSVAPPSSTPSFTSLQATNTASMPASQAYHPPEPRLGNIQTRISFIPNPSSSTASPTPLPSASSSVIPDSRTQTPSSATSTTTSIATTKQKYKSPLGNAEQATNEFLRTELNAAQARIVLLDTTIKDKDPELSVLWARIKIFEEKENKEMLDKYFPHKSSSTAGGNSNRSSTETNSARPNSPVYPQPCCQPPPQCSSHRTCSATPLPCSHCYHPCNPSNTANHHVCTSGPSDDFLNKINEISKELLELKIAVAAMNTKETPVSSKKSSKSNEPPNKPAEDKKPDDSSSTNLNTSFASVEEFIPDLPRDLNCFALTIQPPQLKL